MKKVSFINIEDEGIDLILSFAVYDSEPSAIESLILMRTPRYELLLDDHERGVAVSFKNHEQSSLLKSVVLGTDIVEIFNQENKYILDMRHVDKDELNELEKILKKMNFDNRFTIVRPS
ncbi:hypothetical protein Ping_1838 [Psychromonas ingrahamii 37]|uniref:Uncharacterized protein n=1 Tax=Psychromonas ingrahamii (strain DSM 17664 / CCUG 51855 / 37) TaxID=357804 RepID=A1SVV0_PSYIN|nr:hypothetical protein [Psychromonas ingrahamii]ABM03615.1 hypothetical protein Ping_1838 [Psychromonas ingrahamii 37]